MPGVGAARGRSRDQAGRAAGAAGEQYCRVRAAEAKLAAARARDAEAAAQGRGRPPRGTR